MNIWETIILFFSLQAFLFGILFLVKKQGFKAAHRLFSIFLFLYAYNLFFNVLYWSRFDPVLYASLSGTYYILLGLYGGLFYLYVKRVTTGQTFKGTDLLFFTPLLLVIYQFRSYYFLDAATKQWILATNSTEGYIRFIPYGHLILVVIMLGIGLFSYYKFIKNFSEDPEMKIWLRAVSFSFILFSISHVVYAVLVELVLIPPLFDYFITLFMVLLICLVSYFAYNHSNVFNGADISKVIPFTKYEKTGLSKEFSLELKDKLLSLMEHQKPYLDSDIRLDTIARMLDISRHHASQIINEHFSVHFFDFINKYRIQEAERLLSSQDLSLTIEDIAYQIGFNNRISFYKAFKKNLGCTPTTYRRHYMAS